MATYLSNLIGAHAPVFSGLKKSERKAVVETVLLFMFRGVTAKQLTKAMKVLEASPKAFRMALNSSGYAFRLKAFLYYCYVHELKDVNASKTQRAIAHFQIRATDVVLLRAFDWSPKLAKLLKHYKERKKYKAYSLTRFRQGTMEVAEIVQEYANKFVGKKMRFITSSNGYDVHDLSAELVCHGIQALMNMYPCVESKLHARNIIKRDIHNAGINTIMKYTTKSRGTMYKNKDGTFSSLKVSYESMVNDKSVGQSEFLTAASDGSMSYGVAGDKLENSNDDGIACRQLMAGCKGKKLRLLLLLSGTVDRRFTKFLCAKKLLREGKDNEDYYESLLNKEDGIHTYKNHAYAYLNMDAKKGERFLASLRVKLGGDIQGGQ